MENIRITSGKYRGRAIRSPRSDLTHPMGSREKIALFNMISGELSEAVVLDAFAGSGALGIEALSRGAESVDFIEKSRKIADVLSNNLKIIGAKSTRLFVCDIKNFETKRLYDIILADPPYDRFEAESLANLTKYLKDGGTFVLSHPSLAPEIPGLELTKTRNYAKANISIYQKNT